MKQKPNVQRIRMLMRAENRNYPPMMSFLPKETWPPNTPPGIIEVWRSNQFLAQVYDEGNGVVRISICRTMINKRGGWEEDISWEDLMQVKREIGHGDSYAVEVYPMDEDIVNVANMRHLWIPPKPIVGWRRSPASSEITDAMVDDIMAGNPTDLAPTGEGIEPEYDPHCVAYTKPGAHKE